MSETMMVLGWVGVYGAAVLALIGSMLGCSTAGQAAIGAMLDSDSGYGRFVGVAAMPSSQSIYGIVITLTLNRPVVAENAAALFGVGVLAGAAQLVGAIKQGQCCATAIVAIKEKPEVFGISLGPAALVEGFCVFAFVFALLLAGGIQGGAAG